MKRSSYGNWESPISAEMCASAVIGFQDLVLDGEDIYWSEMRPQEKGRYVIIKCDHDGHTQEVLPAEFNARTRVHEYGGASFTVHQGVIYFSNYADQRVYVVKPGVAPVPLTAEGNRFANFVMTPHGLVAIAETQPTSGEPENFLALIDLNSGQVQKLASGYDFYASPAINETGNRIAWLCWNHPNMPWDDTQLWVADLTAKGLKNPQQIDPGFTEQSFFQPQWGPHDELMVASDKTNWWNLYHVKGDKLIPLFTVQSEIGRPLWVFGGSQWVFYQHGIVCAFAKEGKTQLFHFKEGSLTPFDMPYSSFSQVRTNGKRIACIAGHPQKPTAVVSIKDHQLQILRQNMQLDIDPAFLSKPQHISFENKTQRQAHAYYYAPTNPNFEALDNQKPPLIVRSHGGPTANCGCDLNLEIQYWTSRGYAYVDVNYAGSSGYGRAYRKSLENNWGIYDVEDCEAAAHYLAQKGLVDPNKLAITGGSAGGYTTLAALAFTQSFQVGASHYGVSDLEALVKETHKFEARYLDRLIGPYPQQRQIYLDRSPLYHTEKLSNPVIFFQGDEDKIVPLDQAEKMYQVLKEKGIKTELFVFKGEQHGFRKAENRITVLKEQEKFFREVLHLQ